MSEESVAPQPASLSADCASRFRRSILIAPRLANIPSGYALLISAGLAGYIILLCQDPSQRQAVLLPSYRTLLLESASARENGTLVFDASYNTSAYSVEFDLKRSNQRAWMELKLFTNATQRGGVGGEELDACDVGFNIEYQLYRDEDNEEGKEVVRGATSEEGLSNDGALGTDTCKTGYIELWKQEFIGGDEHYEISLNITVEPNPYIDSTSLSFTRRAEVEVRVWGFNGAFVPCEIGLRCFWFLGTIVVMFLPKHGYVRRLRAQSRNQTSGLKYHQLWTVVLLCGLLAIDEPFLPAAMAYVPDRGWALALFAVDILLQSAFWGTMVLFNVCDLTDRQFMVLEVVDIPRSCSYWGLVPAAVAAITLARNIHDCLESAISPGSYTGITHTGLDDQQRVRIAAIVASVLYLVPAYIAGWASIAELIFGRVPWDRIVPGLVWRLFPLSCFVSFALVVIGLYGFFLSDRPGEDPTSYQRGYGVFETLNVFTVYVWAIATSTLPGRDGGGEGNSAVVVGPADSTPISPDRTAGGAFRGTHVVVGDVMPISKPPYQNHLPGRLSASTAELPAAANV